MAGGSAGGTSRPFTSCWTSVGTPATSETTIGSPEAIASSSTRGTPSPGSVGSTNRSCSRASASTWGSVRDPSKLEPSAIPDARGPRPVPGRAPPRPSCRRSARPCVRRTSWPRCTRSARAAGRYRSPLRGSIRLTVSSRIGAWRSARPRAGVCSVEHVLVGDGRGRRQEDLATGPVVLRVERLAVHERWRAGHHPGLEPLLEPQVDPVRQPLQAVDLDRLGDARQVTDHDQEDRPAQQLRQGVGVDPSGVGMRRLTRSQPGQAAPQLTECARQGPIEGRQAVVERQRAQVDVLGAQAVRLAGERLACARGRSGRPRRRSAPATRRNG